MKVSWRNAVQDPVFTSYIRSKLPSTLNDMNGFDPLEPFDPDLSVGPSFLYDAVTTLGLAMCRAQEPFFIAEDVMPYMKNLSFSGASGDVNFDDESATRNFRSVAFTVWNVRPTEDTQDHESTFELIPSHIYDEGTWKNVRENTFIYPDGTAIPPDVLAPLEPEHSQVSAGGFVAGVAVLAIALFSSVYCLFWTIRNRRQPVVCASQMPFLVLISVGAMVSSLSIVPLAIQETSNNQKTLDFACMAFPWLYTSGLSIAFSALCVKMWRLFEVSQCARLAPWPVRLS